MCRPGRLGSRSTFCGDGCGVWCVVSLVCGLLGLQMAAVFVLRSQSRQNKSNDADRVVLQHDTIAVAPAIACYCYVGSR
jgi:hypothetical protein